MQTARHLDPLVQTVMCGLNEFTHRPIPSVLLAPSPEKILDQGSRLVAAGCDRFLVFGGFVVYDKGAQRGTFGTAEYGSLSVVDQSGRATTWATATFEAQGESTYSPAGPARLLDTRPGSPTVDGLATGLGMRAAGSTTEVAVAGRAGVPMNATSAVLNVTATNEATAGFLTVYPCNTTRPNAAQVNFETNTDVATAVFAKLDPNGKTCIYNSQPTDIVVDVNGFLPLGSSFVPLAPARMIDTRGGYSTVDGAYNGVGVRGGGSTTEIQIGGRGGVPSGASEVAINVTATEVTVDGFVTVFPCNGLPNASNVNYSAGKTATNAVMAPLRDDGRLCVFTSQTIDLVIDVNGYYPKAATFVSMQPTRFVDTRVAPPPPIFGTDIDPAARDANPPLHPAGRRRQRRAQHGESSGDQPHRDRADAGGVRHGVPLRITVSHCFQRELQGRRDRGQPGRRPDRQQRGDLHLQVGPHTGHRRRHQLSPLTRAPVRALPRQQVMIGPAVIA